MILREFVSIVLQEKQNTESRLSSEAVVLLIDNFAQQGLAGRLRWKFSDNLGSTENGIYDPERAALFISTKPRSISDQIFTLLHEIEHWNQHVKVAKKLSQKMKIPITERDQKSVQAYAVQYMILQRRHSYGDHPLEVEAENFARTNLAKAIRLLKDYGVET